MSGRCCNTLLRHYSTFLYNYPQVFLVLTPIFLLICVIFSFVPAVGPDFPDFSKPTKGFEPRGTEIMKRVVTQQNTLKDAILDGQLTCNPTFTRRKRSISLPICHIEAYRKQSVVTVYESDRDIFNVDDLKTICSMEERIVRSTSGFDIHCSCRVLSRFPFECGPSLSLGNYIAVYRNRSSCYAITLEDVSYAKNLLETCSSAYFSGQIFDINIKTQNVSLECVKNGNFIHNVFNLLVDVDFMRSTKTLKSSMVLSPARYDAAFARDIYEKRLSDGRPEQNGVKLVAFQYGNFKFDQFNVQLLLDAVFPAVGLITVALILLIYTHSLLVIALTIFSVITSIIIAYFMYHQVFRLTFFPFLNILTFVFLVGIGADDALIFNDVWVQAKRALPNGNATDWVEYTLKHAALSMFVTSFTTAAAFYAIVVSDITAIRLFGIFSGTSILIMYLLMITSFPAGVVFMEKRRHWRNIGVESIELQDNPSAQLTVDDSKQSPDGSDHPLRSNVNCSQSDSSHLPETSLTNNIYSSTQMTELSHRPCPCRYYSIVRLNCSNFMRNLFDKWLPTSLRSYPILIIAFLALGVGMICAVIVRPGLQRPKSSDFQVFSGSHILEQYDLKYKNKFRLGSADRTNFWVHIYFGLKAEDNGNYFEPQNFGQLQYDDSFNVLLPAAQKWLLENLCSEIQKQKFFGRKIYWRCFLEDFKRRCTSRINNYSLPLNEFQLRQCIGMFYYRSPCIAYGNSLFFQGNKLKGISLIFPTNIPHTNEYATVNSLWEDIKAFQTSVLDKAPEGIQNGWAVSSLRFFALQLNIGSGTISSLGVSLAIAFFVMLLTSLNWVISLYSILTIICTLATTIGSLVLDGWELNILESIVISVAVGLSVDFTLHYGVAYTISSESGRVSQVKYALAHIGPAVTLAALTTFIAGVFMMFSTVLAYFQLGQFLTLVMATSWLFSTFLFMSLCYFAGPVGHFGQINSTKCGSCNVVG